MVAGGEKDLCLQLLQDLIEGLDRFRPGPLAVKEVPRQKDQINLCLAGGVRQAGEQLALLLPAFRRLFRNP